MSKQVGSKPRIMVVLDLMKEYTDDTNGITMKQMQEEIKKQLRLDKLPDRKSVGHDLHELEDLGYEIEQERRGNDIFYHLLSREFTSFELHLLADSVASSKFLSIKTTNELLRKIKRFASIHERESINRQIILTERINDNDRIHTALQTVQRAINSNKQIAYKYTYYDENKKKQRRKKSYEVSPWAIIYADNNYYMLAFDEDKFKHYRIDRMEKYQLLDKDRVGEAEFKKISLDDYQKKVFSMFGGEVKSVTLRFTNNLMNVAIDRFGKNIVPQRVDENHFKIIVPVAVSNQFFGWAFGLGKGVTILAPEDVRQDFLHMLASIHEKNYK